MSLLYLYIYSIKETKQNETYLRSLTVTDVAVVHMKQNFVIFSGKELKLYGNRDTSSYVSFFSQTMESLAFLHHLLR